MYMCEFGPGFAAGWQPAIFPIRAKRTMLFYAVFIDRCHVCFPKLSLQICIWRLSNQYDSCTLGMHGRWQHWPNKGSILPPIPLIWSRWTRSKAIKAQNWAWWQGERGHWQPQAQWAGSWEQPRQWKKVKPPSLMHHHHHYSAGTWGSSSKPGSSISAIVDDVQNLVGHM